VVVDEAVNASSADEASKVTHSLTVGGKTYNGSEEVEITAKDLGLGNALRFIGTTTTEITNQSTTPTTVVINTKSVKVA
jgi:hypothetical protein